MNSQILDQLSLDPAVLVFVLAGMVLILAIVDIIMIVRMGKMYRRYDFFMRGKDAETLEDKIARICVQMNELQDQALENRDIMRVINRSMSSTYQKSGFVKYNAFDGMGGQSSFALAMLDAGNNGFLLNAMHSRTSCYIYLKEIKEGEPDSLIGKEEKEALLQAMGSGRKNVRRS